MPRIETRKPLILLTNDDGFFSEGLETLYRQLKGLARIFIVAPDRDKSATSLSLTLHRPLRAKRIRPSVYAVDGTPADCIYLALEKILPRKPDLIISGLNHGPNLGQQDIAYSGTVAAAFQGTFLEIPSIAISVVGDHKRKFNFDFSASIARQFAESLLLRRLPTGITLNINIPPPPVKGIKITRLGQKRYNPEIIEKKDPRRNSYFWIGAGAPKPLGGKDSDVAAVLRGYISVTPLHTDLTDYAALRLASLRNLLTKVRL
jgi:5'-nucleotidase